ncbi:MAG: hypothetical protein MZV70_69375 [Desulfobacterales bacterium]|nr:hypothetical protein [Desulfobacterales bacterium]
MAGALRAFTPGEVKDLLERYIREARKDRNSEPVDGSGTIAAAASITQREHPPPPACIPVHSPQSTVHC